MKGDKGRHPKSTCESHMHTQKKIHIHGTHTYTRRQNKTPCQAGDVVQLVGCLPGFLPSTTWNGVWWLLSIIPTLRKWGRRSEVQHHLQVHSKFHTSMGYKSLSQMKTKTKKKLVMLKCGECFPRDERFKNN